MDSGEGAFRLAKGHLVSIFWGLFIKGCLPQESILYKLNTETVHALFFNKNKSLEEHSPRLRFVHKIKNKLRTITRLKFLEK